MLDPFSCLNIAAAAAQFIEFAVALLSTAREVYQAHGSLEKIDDFESRVLHFKGLCADLRKATKDSRDAGSEESRSLRNVGKKCEVLSADILEFLDGIKGKSGPGKINSLKVAFKAETRSKDLVRCRAQLMEMKVDLSTQLLIALGMSYDEMMMAKSQKVAGLISRDTNLSIQKVKPPAWPILSKSLRSVTMQPRLLCSGSSIVSRRPLKTLDPLKKKSKYISACEVLTTARVRCAGCLQGSNASKIVEI